MAKNDIFLKEGEILEEVKSFVKEDAATKEQYKEKLVHLGRHFEELISQAQLITKVSDRLQHKLNNLNDKLGVKNVELQETIDELTRARVSRKATTIVLLVAIVLFLVSEAVIEPWIESQTTNFWIGLGSKFSLMLLLKPIDFVVEKALMQAALNKKKTSGEQSES